MSLKQESNLPSELGKPAQRALVGAGYPRSEQLATLRESEVAELHGVGPKALGQLRRAFDARGLSFADEKYNDRNNFSREEACQDR